MKPEDIQDLKQLIECLKENQVAEFDLDRGDTKIRLKFNQAVAPAVAHVLGSVPIVAAQAVSLSVPPPTTPAADPDAGLHMVRSPIVGTFYGSPSPEAAAFVTPGDHVDKGAVVCIIEAMKLMNAIDGAAAGEVMKCPVTNCRASACVQP